MDDVHSVGFFKQVEMEHGPGHFRIDFNVINTPGMMLVNLLHDSGLGGDDQDVLESGQWAP